MFITFFMIMLKNWCGTYAWLLKVHNFVWGSDLKKNTSIIHNGESHISNFTH